MEFFQFGRSALQPNYADYLLRGLFEFWKLHPGAEQPLRAGYAEAKKASWNSPAEI
jgi:hypothetical protein